MFLKQSKITKYAIKVPRINWRAVRLIIEDCIGAISIFGTGYLILLIGHGLGLN